MTPWQLKISDRQDTHGERKIRLADYAAGLHPEDELLHLLDAAMTLDIVEQDGVQSFEVGADQALRLDGPRTNARAIGRMAVLVVAWDRR
jgi:hypothetical protein